MHPYDRVVSASRGFDRHADIQAESLADSRFPVARGRSFVEKPLLIESFDGDERGVDGFRRGDRPGVEAIPDEGEIFAPDRASFEHAPSARPGRFRKTRAGALRGTSCRLTGLCLDQRSRCDIACGWGGRGRLLPFFHAASERQGEQDESQARERSET